MADARALIDWAARGLDAVQAAVGTAWRATGPPAFDLVRPLWDALAPWLEGPYAFVSISIVVLLLLHVLLVLYTLYLRVAIAVEARRTQSKQHAWADLLIAYLADELGSAAIAVTVGRRDMRRFSTYIQPYLLDFEGEEKERLIALMRDLGYPAYLHRLMHSRMEWQRSFAAHLVGIMGDQEAIPVLRALLGDRSELVRYTVAEALMQLRDLESVPRILTWLASGDTTRSDRVLALVHEFGSEICPALMDVVNNPQADPRVTRVAMSGLAHYLHLAATWPILELSVRTTDRELRLAALRALTAMEDTTLVGFFEDLLRDPDKAVRAIAARAVGNIGDDELVPRLLELVGSDDFWVANESVRALLALGPAGRSALLEAQGAGQTSDVADLLILELMPAAPDATAPA